MPSSFVTAERTLCYATNQSTLSDVHRLCTAEDALKTSRPLPGI